jgi:hypothetical protein
LTTSEAARQLGIGARRLQRIFERGDVPEPARLGHSRIIYAADVERVQRYLRQVGADSEE